jgi:hypothetical protein
MKHPDKKRQTVGDANTNTRSIDETIGSNQHQEKNWLIQCRLETSQ